MKILIDNKRLKELEDAERRLCALEAGGVDNWEFYGDSLEEYEKEKEREEEIENVLQEIQEVLFSNAYEPSERGAGYCAREEDQITALDILVSFVRKIVKKD